MGKLKTETIKDKRGNIFKVTSYKLDNGDVIFSTKNSLGKVVNAGKFKTKAMVIKHERQFLRG